MLSEIDYLSLKGSVKGWNAKRLSPYGVTWPPAHGWRKGLLKEYESGHAPAWQCGIDPAETERLSMKRLYQEKSGDHTYQVHDAPKSPCIFHHHNA